MPNWCLDLEPPALERIDRAWGGQSSGFISSAPRSDLFQVKNAVLGTHLIHDHLLFGLKPFATEISEER
jgi:hypothetical protein